MCRTYRYIYFVLRYPSFVVHQVHRAYISEIVQHDHVYDRYIPSFVVFANIIWLFITVFSLNPIGSSVRHLQLHGTSVRVIFESFLLRDWRPNGRRQGRRRRQKVRVKSASTSQMSGGCGRGGRRGRRSRRPRYRRTLHGEAPAVLLALDPRPLQGTDQGVSKVFGEEAINVKCDRVIDHLQ